MHSPCVHTALTAQHRLARRRDEMRIEALPVLGKAGTIELPFRVTSCVSGGMRGEAKNERIASSKGREASPGLEFDGDAAIGIA